MQWLHLCAQKHVLVFSISPHRCTEILLSVGAVYFAHTVFGSEKDPLQNECLVPAICCLGKVWAGRHDMCVHVYMYVKHLICIARQVTTAINHPFCQKLEQN